MVRKAGVYTLLFIRDPQKDQILLIYKKRGFGKDKWNGIGGKVEDNETIHEAVIRESREETGIIPLNPSWRGILHFQNYTSQQDTWEDMLVHVYETTRWQGSLVETEEARPAWWSIQQIPYAEMWEDDAYWLPRFLRGEHIAMQFTFHDWKLRTWHDLLRNAHDVPDKNSRPATSSRVPVSKEE